MDSCDTLVLTGKMSSTGKTVLFKNSDRPLGEAQPLCFYDREDGKYAVLGSRPTWISGFEMGANEKGVFIANEAEGSRVPAETEEGMLGMDILREALEKASTAREAIDIISGLLAAFGQNKNAHPTMDRRYENSFIITDPAEAYVMETAGREWAAKKVKDFAAVSNCYTITTDYDLCSPGMEKTVTANRWLRPGEAVNFAKAYTKPADRQRNSVPRMRRMIRLVKEASENGKIDDGMLRKIFRDHFEGEINEPRFGAAYGGFTSICMHALTDAIDSSQTAASMYMAYDERFRYKFLWAAGVPCLSVYLPLYWVNPEKKGMKIPECMSIGGDTYDPRSLWWTMERLGTLVSMDEERFGLPVRESLAKLEKGIEARTLEAEEEAEELIECGNLPGASKRLSTLTESCTEMLLQTAGLLTAVLSMEISKTGGLYGPRKEILESYMKRTGMPFDWES